MNTIINSIREYFLNCPILDENSPINIDYLGKEPLNYSIDSMPVDPIVRQYTDGSAIKQYVFSLNAQERYSIDSDKNLENIGFYEHLTDWVKQQNRKRNLPLLPKGKEAVKLENTTGGYLFNAEENTAIYQITFRLIYFEQR